MNQYRRCRTCGEDKPVTDYCKSTKRIDGLVPDCLPCRSAAYKEYRKRVPRDKVKAAAYAREYSKRRKQKELTFSEKEKRAESRRRFYQENKLRLNEQHKEYLRRNPGKNAQQVNTYKQRLKQNGVFSFSAKDIKRLTSGVCAYCGETGKMAVDHVLPVSKGGRHAIGNLLPTCLPCNSSKHAKLLIVWRLQRLKEGNPLIFETMQLRGGN
jgi:5-methylcytosine-specific restriction endonuclease McrA